MGRPGEGLLFALPSRRPWLDKIKLSTISSCEISKLVSHPYSVLLKIHSFFFARRLAKSIVDGDEEEVRNALKVYNPDDKCVLININVQKLQDIYSGKHPLYSILHIILEIKIG